jgi:hypothetical protein
MRRKKKRQSHSTKQQQNEQQPRRLPCSRPILSPAAILPFTRRRPQRRAAHNINRMALRPKQRKVLCFCFCCPGIGSRVRMTRSACTRAHAQNVRCIKSESRYLVFGLFFLSFFWLFNLLKFSFVWFLFRFSHRRRRRIAPSLPVESPYPAPLFTLQFLSPVCPPPVFFFALLSTSSLQVHQYRNTQTQHICLVRVAIPQNRPSTVPNAIHSPKFWVSYKTEGEQPCLTPPPRPFRADRRPPPHRQRAPLTASAFAPYAPLDPRSSLVASHDVSSPAGPRPGAVAALAGAAVGRQHHPVTGRRPPPEQLDRPAPGCAADGPCRASRQPGIEQCAYIHCCHVGHAQTPSFNLNAGCGTPRYRLPGPALGAERDMNGWRA